MPHLLPFLYIELRSNLRGGASSWQSIALFSMLIAFLPFAYGIEPEALRGIAIRSMWFLAILVQMLSTASIFHTDYEDGTLEILNASHLPLPFYAAGKLLITWLFYGLPLILCTPVLALLYDFSNAEILRLALSLIIGSFGLCALNMLGAALTLAMPRGNLMAVLFVLPLSVPILIFGITAAVDVNLFTSALSGLLGLLLLYTVLACASIPSILRIVLGK